MGLLQTSVYAGTVGGGYWAGVIAQRHGWRISILFFGALGCVLGLMLIPVLREPRRGSADDGIADAAQQGLSSRHATWQSVTALMKIKSLLALMGVFACANFVALVLLTWIPSYLYSRFHLNLARAAFDAAVYPQVASMFGSVIGGYLADFFARMEARSRFWVQCGGVLAGAPFVVMCGLGRSIDTVLIALVAWGFCKGIYDSNIFASAFDVVPIEARGTASGLMNCIGWLIGGGTAPVAIGFVATYVGLGRAIAISSSVYVLAGVVLVFAATRLLRADMVRVQLLDTPRIEPTTSAL